ncbi:hypothetical protein [Nonomuraea sp. NPDC049028]|uniref:hypothetical protein n=1 Tax=Nonomuraea sp. NPDC049028 TaxID=3364348 RepID=UPI003714AB8F
MLAVLSTIASLVIVLILAFLAVFLISVAVLLALALMAGSTAHKSEVRPVMGGLEARLRGTTIGRTTIGRTRLGRKGEQVRPSA